MISCIQLEYNATNDKIKQYSLQHSKQNYEFKQAIRHSNENKIELHGIHLLAYYMADLVWLSQEIFSRFCEIHWDHLHISLDFLKDMTKVILTTLAQCD